MTDSNKRLNVSVYANSHCPPCEFFDAEVVDSSVSWTGSDCDRADYGIDCKHRKVCGIRHEWRSAR